MRYCVHQEEAGLRSIGATLAATVSAAVVFVSAVFLMPEFAQAKDAARLNTPPASEAPGAHPPAQQNGNGSGSNGGSNGGSGNTSGSCTCPGSSPADDAAERARRWPKPALADHSGPTTRVPEYKQQLDDTDEVAAFEALHLGLTEVADGATYVWHRANGRLSGAVQPTQSFKASNGQICRHIVVSLSSGTMHRRTEGIACRAGNGVWSLNG
jgi:surface antigen